MSVLDVALLHDIIWDAFKFGLESLNCVSQIRDSRQGSFGSQVLRRLDNNEVDFLSFAVSLDPAEFNRWLALLLIKCYLDIRVWKNSSDFSAVLGCSESNIFFVLASDGILDIDGNFSWLGCYRHTDWVCRVQQELQWVDTWHEKREADFRKSAHFY